MCPYLYLKFIESPIAHITDFSNPSENWISFIDRLADEFGDLEEVPVLTHFLKELIKVRGQYMEQVKYIQSVGKLSVDELADGPQLKSISGKTVMQVKAISYYLKTHQHLNRELFLNLIDTVDYVSEKIDIYRKYFLEKSKLKQDFVEFYRKRKDKAWEGLDYYASLMAEMPLGQALTYLRGKTVISYRMRNLPYGPQFNADMNQKIAMVYENLRNQEVRNMMRMDTNNAEEISRSRSLIEEVNLRIQYLKSGLYQSASYCRLLF